MMMIFFSCWQVVGVLSLVWCVLLWFFRFKCSNCWEEARCWRSLVFAVLASAAGPYLLVNIRHWPRQALIDTDGSALVVFAVAASHWFLSFGEEIAISSKKNLAAGAEASTYFTNFNTEELGSLVKTGYVIHHGLSSFIYFYALSTRTLAGPATFGLIYEMPVVFQHLRELSRLKRYPPPSHTFWKAWIIAFFLARTTPTLVYFFSTLYSPWRHRLYKLIGRSSGIAMYHTAALSFTYLNFSYGMLLMSWYDADCSRCEAEAKGGEEENSPASSSSHASSSTSQIEKSQPCSSGDTVVSHYDDDHRYTSSPGVLLGRRIYTTSTSSPPKISALV